MAVQHTKSEMDLSPSPMWQPGWGQQSLGTVQSLQRPCPHRTFWNDGTVLYIDSSSCGIILRSCQNSKSIKMIIRESDINFIFFQTFSIFAELLFRVGFNAFYLFKYIFNLHFFIFHFKIIECIPHWINY